MRRELSFDGKGINGPDEYRTRVATFTNHENADKYGRLFEAAPELLTALKRAVNLLECAEVSFLHQSSPAIVPREFYELIADIET